MIELWSKYLLYHGAIILMSGILTGLVFWLVIITGKPAESVRAWRVTHSVLIADGLLMLISALCIPHLTLDSFFIWKMVIAFIISGYGFAFAFIIGAWKGIRGLKPWPFGLNTILFVGHFSGASGSLIGVALLIYGLFHSL